MGTSNKNANPDSNPGTLKRVRLREKIAVDPKKSLTPEKFLQFQKLTFIGLAVLVFSSFVMGLVLELTYYQTGRAQRIQDRTSAR